MKVDWEAFRVAEPIIRRMRSPMRIWITNNKVAWEVPCPISLFLLWGYYTPPEGWLVTERRLCKGWRREISGVMRLRSTPPPAPTA